MTDKGCDELELKVYDYCCRKGLLDLDGIVVGLSGGPDSVFLLTLLDKFRREKKINCDIVAVHVNHNLRPEDCDKDEAFVQDLCAAMNIRLFTESADVAKKSEDLGISVEEAGRRIRYSCFRRIAGSFAPRRYMIATAHHDGDLAETMMMNLFRGTGLDGMTAMQPVSDDLIRPLLCVSKKEIIEYLDARGISYCTDKTNFEDIGTRNVWRNKILPFIGEYTSRDPEDALNATHALLSKDREFIEGAAEEAYGRCAVDIGPFRAIDCGCRDFHAAIYTRILRRLWKETFDELTDLEAVNLNIAQDLMRKTGLEGFTSVDMPFGRIMWRMGDLAGFAEPGDTEAVACALAERDGYITSSAKVAIELCDGVKDNIPGTNLAVECSVVENIDDLSYNNHSWICPLDSPLLQGHTLVLENDCKAAKFTKAGSYGGKLLKDILADRKVPRPARAFVLAAVAGDTALWVPGAGHAAGFTDALSRDRFQEDGYEGRYLAVRISSEE